MKVNVFFTKVFERKYNSYKKKYFSIESDLKDFISNILNEKSDDLGGGIHKYRLLVRSKGKGKSGGLRIITLEAVTLTTEKDITL